MQNEPNKPDHLVVVDTLEKRYTKGGVPVFSDISFSIDRGEIVCMIGHSGCGKSTILNILAGLESASSGQVSINGHTIRGPGLDRGVVFQGHALMPWLTVEQNVAMAIRSRHPGMQRGDVKNMTEHYLGLVSLKEAMHKRPSELSGGMRQRVGIARAFSTTPELLLMDEPFGALDALTRGVIQDELLNICAQTHQTVFMITHDIDEAILLADRLLLMSSGPNAHIAEVVQNPLPKERSRAEIHHQKGYSDLRNHIMDFLVQKLNLKEPKNN